MNTFRLVINTPKGTYLDKKVEELYLNTSSGYMGIFANADTLIIAVEIAPGFIQIDGKKNYYAFFSGVLYIKKEGVYLIVSNIEEASSIDLKRANESKERALERLKKRDHDTDIKRAETSLKRAIARIGAINKDFI